MSKTTDNRIKTNKKPYIKSETKLAITGFLFALPGIIYLIGLNLVPILQSAYYSLCNYSVLTKPVFVGLANYKMLFRDTHFYNSLYNTFYMVVATPITLGFALSLAMMLNMKVKNMPIYRAIFYIPSLIPMVVTAILWRWIFNSQTGVLNYFFELIGLESPLWLIDPAWTKPALIIMGIWGAGSTMIIYLAALQGVPDSLYEAAELDGANALHKFWHVTLPFISPITLFLLITAVINNFQYFTPAYVFANSQDLVSQYGPGNSLEFYAFHLYNLAFKNLQMGYASAFAWVLFVIIAVVAVIIFKSSLKWVYYDDGGNS